MISSPCLNLNLKFNSSKHGLNYHAYLPIHNYGFKYHDKISEYDNREPKGAF